VGNANGDRIPMVGICKAVPIRIGKEDFSIDLYAIKAMTWCLAATGCAPWALSFGISSTRRWHSGVGTIFSEHGLIFH
jgi:hypothetical protein